MHTPGLKVVAPASVADAYGLLRSAIDDDNPVIFLEHKLLYLQKTSGELRRDTVPLGQARVVRPGRDVTIVAYSQMVVESLRAATMLSRQGIEAEVIDLRSLVPLDGDTLVESVTRTGRALVVAEDTRTAGVAAEVASHIAEHAFDYLEAPVRRHTTPDVPVPAAPALEEAALPRAPDIAAAAHALVGYGQ